MLKFSDHYQNIKLIKINEESYRLVNSTNESNPIVEFLFNGFEFDVFFGNGGYTELFLNEVIILLNHLNSAAKS